MTTSTLRLGRTAALGLCLFLLVATTATAQRRAVGSVLVLPTVQAEYALEGDDYLLLDIQQSTYTGNSQSVNGLRVRGGYEHFWNTQWSGGGQIDVQTGTGNVILQTSTREAVLRPEAFLRHWNTLGKVNFRQRLGLGYNLPTATGLDSRGYANLRLDVERPVSLGTVLLRPRLAYEVTSWIRLQRDEATQPKERFIDFGYARAELGVRVANLFDFTPWFGYQTAYVFTLAQTDANQQIKIPASRFNSVTPVVGLDARFTLFSGSKPFERRQLPTQH